jgi:septum formation protein
MLESTRMTPALVLASNSPRRRQLLALTGWNFTLRPASIDESPSPGEHPGEYVLRLAGDKAVAAAQDGPPALYLGSDTTVADGMEILGKPLDDQDAGRILRQLRGKEHTVYTAVVLHDTHSARTVTEICATRVPMRSYSDAEIETYIRSGDPQDKAGAYGIQHPEFNPVERFRGCFASVMGLPLCHLERGLRQLYGPSPADVPAACQAALNYNCPVYTAILRGETAG